MRVGDPDGHGHYGHLEEIAEGLICHDCGQPWHNLASHARYTHGYTDAMDYRQQHGLKRQRPLLSQSTRDTLKSVNDKHRDANLARLAASRDPAAATKASVEVITSPGNRSPASRESRKEYLQSRRGRDLTPKEITQLDKRLPMEEWCRRAHLLLRDPTLTRASIARSLKMPNVTVYQRLTNHPEK